jgi:hypothetical protein
MDRTRKRKGEEREKAIPGNGLCPREVEFIWQPYVSLGGPYSAILVSHLKVQGCRLEGGVNR